MPALRAAPNAIRVGCQHRQPRCAFTQEAAGRGTFGPHNRVLCSEISGGVALQVQGVIRWATLPSVPRGERAAAVVVGHGTLSPMHLLALRQHPFTLPSCYSCSPHQDEASCSQQHAGSRCPSQPLALRPTFRRVVDTACQTWHGSIA